MEGGSRIYNSWSTRRSNVIFFIGQGCRSSNINTSQGELEAAVSKLDCRIEPLEKMFQE